MAKRNKMSIAQRAKQFIPFAALDGLEEALEKKELENSKKNVFKSVNKKIKAIKTILFNLNYNETHSIEIIYENTAVRKISCLSSEIILKKDSINIGKLEIPFENIIELSVLN